MWDSRVGMTYHREETTVYPTDALFSDDRHCAMEQSTIPRIRALRIVDELRSSTECINDCNLAGALFKTDFIVSEGVTAKIASIIPAPSPATLCIRKGPYGGIMHVHTC